MILQGETVLLQWNIDNTRGAGRGPQAEQSGENKCDSGLPLIVSCDSRIHPYCIEMGDLGSIIMAQSEKARSNDDDDDLVSQDKIK